VQDGTSDVKTGAQGAQIDARSGAQVQLPAQVQLQARVQLPAQVPGRNSNSTGSARSLIEPLELSKGRRLGDLAD
jgi:hypothetical protein